MPERPITNRQYKDYIKLRTQYTQDIAAAKAGIGQSSAFSKKQERRHVGGKPDPLVDLWGQEKLPTIETASQVRPASYRVCQFSFFRDRGPAARNPTANNHYLELMRTSRA